MHFDGDELVRKKADSTLKNYKLKFSRLLTCFPMVANLAAQSPPISAADVLGDLIYELIKATADDRRMPYLLI